MVPVLPGTSTGTSGTTCSTAVVCSSDDRGGTTEFPIHISEQ
jgi:hypothetical protein